MFSITKKAEMKKIYSVISGKKRKFDISSFDYLQ